MSGPRYVEKFNFPAEFGFTGSATDYSRVRVNGYERRFPRKKVPPKKPHLEEENVKRK